MHDWQRTNLAHNKRNTRTVSEKTSLEFLFKREEKNRVKN